jgi:hypothetical protein
MAKIKTKRQEVTKENIGNFLRKASGSKYHFYFPWMPKGYRSLIMGVIGGTLSYSSRKRVDFLVFDRAFDIYNEKLEALKEAKVPFV